MNLFSLGWSWSNIWMDLWISLNSVVYQLIEWLYEVFEAVANVNLFSREAFNDITSRLYVVIGIAMLFIFAYNIILMIINPDDKKNIGNTSKIVKETVIAFVMIILLPTIFNYLSIFQKNVLDSHILEQIIMGSTAGTTIECDFSDLELIDSYVTVKNGTPVANMEAECDIYHNTLSESQKGAYLVAPTLFTAFFHPTNYGYDECVDYLVACKGKGSDCVNGPVTTKDDKELCANFVYDTNMGQFKGGIMEFTTDGEIYADAWSKKGIFDFNYLMAIIAGGVAVWMFVCYAMAIGVRVAKLGFLQIISPIPVMLRIIPKQKEAVYDKWFKHLLNAYLDVFIRLAIIYFCMFAISLVPDVFDSLFAGLTGWWGTKALSMVVVILGILMFAQQAPELFKEFFGGMGGGNFALKSPRKQFMDNKYAVKGTGAVAGAIGTGAVAVARNWKKTSGGVGAKLLSVAGGLAGGIIKGGATGYKNGVDKTVETISTTADQLEVNRDKHKAIREQGIRKTIEKQIQTKKESFKDFLFGNVASPELGNAANVVMGDIDSMEADFSNATINGIKDGRAEIMKKFNADQEFDFNGKHYTKTDDTHWSDGAGNVYESGELSKYIVDSYKDRLAKAYADNEVKDGIYDGFKRANEGMLKDLRAGMPKFGDKFAESLFSKLNGLNDADGLPMNLNVDSLDALENKMKNLMAKENLDGTDKTEAQLKADLACLYKINDEIKGLTKGIKISNDQALKEQQAKKEKKNDK